MPCPLSDNSRKKVIFDDPQILIPAHSNQCDPVMSIQIKARYNGKNFLPLKSVDLPTDTDVILEIKTDPVT
ncbi:MAG: hypothetical protein STSR0009_23540 [Methanoregula sp.]